jgi:glycosylphosphatidylinositol phospholipase D
MSFIAVLLLGCNAGDRADTHAPVIEADEVPPASVLSDREVEATLAVSDPDSRLGELVVHVTAPSPPVVPPQVGADGALVLRLVPRSGQNNILVEVEDPGGNTGVFEFAFEGVSGDEDGDGALAQAFGGDDCDDTDPGVAPGLPEQCDGVDQDCDGRVDEDPADGLTRWPDGDGDGFGADGEEYTACEVDVTSVDRGGDCNDGDPFVHAGVTQLGKAGCEGIGPTFEWLGEAAGDRAGDNVRDGGDLDGDGLSEVLVCSPEYAGASGAVYVVGATAPGKSGLALAPVKWVGEAPTDGAGFDFLAPGDLDGDGVPDLLIGAAGHNEALGGEGAIYIVLGPFAGESSLADAHARLLGDDTDDQLGDTAAGDLDGDGVPELILGARLSDANGPDAGAVYVLAPPAAGTFRISDLATTRLLGDAPGEIAGDPFLAGDLDGDGLDEVGILTQEDATQGLHGGAVYVVFAPLPPGDLVLDVADAKWTGNAGSILGHAGDGAGDLDGDGRGDAVFGAPYDSPNGDKSGTAYVVLGPGPAGLQSIAATADAVLEGDTLGIRAGFSVSRVGDITGDGVLDLFIGAKFDDTVGTNAGSAYVAPGPFAGTSLLGTTGLKILGEAAGDLAGDVGGVTDLDGDGIPDLLMGARHTAETGVDAGSAYLVFGARF